MKMAVVSNARFTSKGFVVFLLMADALTCVAAPCSIAGQMQWDAHSSQIKWCDGNGWQYSSGTTGASCVGKRPGDISGAGGTPSYCNGTNWIKMSEQQLGSCQGLKSGTFKAFGASPVSFQYCNGTNWWNLVSSANPGSGVSSGGSSPSAPTATNPSPAPVASTGTCPGRSGDGHDDDDDGHGHGDEHGDGDGHRHGDGHGGGDVNCGTPRVP
jgi:hypothetical protein